MTWCLCRCLAGALLLLASVSVSASNITIRDSGGTTVSYTSIDSRCSSLQLAVNAVQAQGLGWRVMACSSQVLKVGDTISFMTVGDTSAISYSIQAMTAPPPAITLESLNDAVLVLQASSPAEPFDSFKAAGLFAFFFSFIVGVWVFCKNIGLILNAVRRW